MSDYSLTEELNRAAAALAPPPGESPVMAEDARQGAVLLACLRYSGMDENEIDARLNRLDRTLVADQAVLLQNSDKNDAAEAAGLLRELLQRTDVEIDQVLAVASLGATDGY
jgi:hypothetical protein